jgi:hypothetical protein
MVKSQICASSPPPAYQYQITVEVEALQMEGIHFSSSRAGSRSNPPVVALFCLRSEMCGENTNPRAASCDANHY